MLKILKLNPLARAVGVMGVTAGLVSAVTFANFTSAPVSLTGNTLASATAALVINNNADCATTTATSVSGMTFDHLIPGVQSAPFTFCLKNTDTALSLSVTAKVVGTPVVTGFTENDLSFEFTDGVNTVTKTLAELETGAALPSNPLSPTQTRAYAVRVTLAGSVTNSGSVAPFEIQFTGTQS